MSVLSPQKVYFFGWRALEYTHLLDEGFLRLLPSFCALSAVASSCALGPRRSTRSICSSHKRRTNTCMSRPTQGVNSALEDVNVLERALENCGDCVETALPAYEQARAADSKALVRVRLRFFAHHDGTFGVCAGRSSALVCVAWCSCKQLQCRSSHSHCVDSSAGCSLVSVRYFSAFHPGRDEETLRSRPSPSYRWGTAGGRGDWISSTLERMAPDGSVAARANLFDSGVSLLGYNAS